MPRIFLLFFLFFLFIKDAKLSDSSFIFQKFEKQKAHHIQQRAHTQTCPLEISGPGKNFFSHEPQSFPKLDSDHYCSDANRTGSLTCCQPNYFDQVQANPLKDPFGASAIHILSDISTPCLNKLTKFTCGICREHQDSFVQNHSSFSEVRLCLSFIQDWVSTSYCQNLLKDCDDDLISLPKGENSNVHDEYGSDAARFCIDLFARVENVDVSVSVDVDKDGDLSTLRSHCFSDVKECSKDDFKPFYSECDHVTDSRTLYYDYKEDSSCRGGEPLPDPVENLPCYSICPPGSYQPYGEQTCEFCSAGTHSVGGDYEDTWRTWPDHLDFTTYCESNDGKSIFSGVPLVDDQCRGWVLKDSFIASGAVRDAQQSLLKLDFHLVRDGLIGFEYKVLAEPVNDGLIFVIDDEVIMPIKTQVLEWKSFNHSLSPGFHKAVWYFYKDYAGTSNLDEAMIHKIFIVGTKWADSQCELCSPGYGSTVGSQFCSKCPFNTYSDSPGANDCISCPSSQYAPVGSTQCFDRPACTEDETSVTFSPCERNSRNKTTHFNDNVICDTTLYDLPDNETDLPCPTCNPGMHRPEGNKCQFCEPGYHSETGEACDICPAGKFAPKHLVYTQFDEWENLPGLHTACIGDCAADGWRLLGDKLDSNIGHGALVDSHLFLVVNIAAHGDLVWQYSISCSNMCRFQITDVGVPGGTHVYFADETYNSGPYKRSFPVGPGLHKFQIVFSKFDPSFDAPMDRLIIHEIAVTGGATGGALSCDSCSPGYFSKEGAEDCIPCKKGTYAAERNAARCDLCSPGTFSNQTGASACTNCGHNTESTKDRTDCDYNNCVFIAAEGVVYDLSPLEPSTPDDIYGPVVDQQQNSFYFSPCSRKYSVKACYDQWKQPMETHVCQILATPNGYYTLNLGSIMGYSPLEDESFGEDPLRSGLVMMFTEGEQTMCNITEGSYAPLTTNITFRCHPNAGTGYPIPEPVQNANCQWDSKYACPRCTEENYEVVYGPCIGNLQTRTFLPKSYPNPCTGGFTPPPIERVVCLVSNVNCPPGTYFPIGTEDDVDDNDDDNDDDDDDSKKCVEAEPGHYSIGGGEVIDRFETYENSLFETTGSWLMMNEFIRSGNGDTEFTSEVFLLVNGNVTFEYKVYAPSLEEDEPGFRFFVDKEEIMFSRDTNFSYVTYTHSLPSGGHTLQWRFTTGSLPTKFERGNYAIIDEIQIFGLYHAARFDYPCPSGTYQPKKGQSSCLTCPAGNWSAGGSKSCEKCDESSYSFPGSSFCEPRLPCQGRDFVRRQLSCDESGHQFQFYQFLEPKICLFTELPFPNETSVDCEPCPFGYIREEGGCVPCPLGQYFVPALGRCSPAPTGYFANLSKIYFPTLPQSSEKREQTENGQFYQSSDFPEGFWTRSSFGNSGWRVLNSTIESGYHSTIETDSVLLYSLTLLQHGRISFTYYLSPLRENEEDLIDDDGDGNNYDPFFDGLQFFINGEVQNIPYHPEDDIPLTVSFPLKLVEDGNKTEIELKWLYHQPDGSRRRNRIILSDILVHGDSRGTSVSVLMCPPGTSSKIDGGGYYCEPCPVGTYANNEGTEVCLSCDEHYFSDKVGTVECERCGIGTSSSENRTICDISECVFSDGEFKWDMSVLGQAGIQKLGVEFFRLEFSLCDRVDPRESECFDKNNVLLKTYACAIDRADGVSYSTGDVANIFYNEGEVLFRYNRGAGCRHDPQFGTTHAETDVIMICDMNVTLPDENVTLISHDECKTVIEWRNSAACRFCVDWVDYEAHTTQCHDNVLIWSLVKKPNATCHGPEVWTREERECTNTYPVPLSFVLAGVGVFVILVCSFVIIVIRNRKLTERYDILVNESMRNSGPARESG